MDALLPDCKLWLALNFTLSREKPRQTGKRDDIDRKIAQNPPTQATISDGKRRKPSETGRTRQKQRAP